MTKAVRPTQHNSTLPARTQPLPRSSRSLLSAGTPKKVNRKRKASEWARAYGSPARVAFVVWSLPCAACGDRPCENAHTANGGAGRKADADTICPLCRKCHRTQHAKGWTVLELEFGFDRTGAAKETQRAWLAHTGD